MIRAALVAALVMVATTPVAAQPAAPDTAPLVAAIEAGQNGEAYRMAIDLVATAPDDPAIRYLAALTCLGTVRPDELDRHLAAGFRLDPEHAALLGMSAHVALGRGDEVAARADSERALQRDPEAYFGLLVRDQLALEDRARARMEGDDPGLPPRSPAGFVDGIAKKVSRGADGSELARFFDLEILELLPPASRTHHTLAEFIDGLFGEMRGAGNQRVIGWIVEPTVDTVGELTWVSIQVPTEITLTPSTVAGLRAALEDPSLRGAVNPEWIAALLSVPEDERAAMLDRMRGLRQRVVVPLRMQVAGADADYRVTDVEANGVSMKAQLGTLRDLSNKVAPELASPRDDRPRKSLAYRMGRILGPGILVIAIVLIAMVATRNRS